METATVSAVAQEIFRQIPIVVKMEVGARDFVFDVNALIFRVTAARRRARYALIEIAYDRGHDEYVVRLLAGPSIFGAAWVDCRICPAENLADCVVDVCKATH
jgi:predicted lipoprotein